MAAIAEAKREWQLFRKDEPGHRFQNHRQRMKHKPTKFTVAMMALGVLLLAGGVVLLFIPGPGSVLIVFGLALVGGQSKTVAKLLDRAEPPLRRAGRKAKRAWRTASIPAKVGLVGIGVLGAAGLALLAYRQFFA